MQYSTHNKWISIDLESIQNGSNEELIFDLNFAAKDASIADYHAINMEDAESFDTEWPVIKFALTKAAHSKRTLLSDPKLKSWSIQTDVSDVRDVILQNDDGLMKVEKPFRPFGAQPYVGSNLYIGHSEIFSKNLSSLS